MNSHAFIYLFFTGCFLNISVYCYDDKSSTYYGSGGGGVTIIIVVACCCGWRKRRNSAQEVSPPTVVSTGHAQPVYPVSTPIHPGSYKGSGKYNGQIISLPPQQLSASSISAGNQPPPYSAVYYKPTPKKAAEHKSQHILSPGARQGMNVSTGLVTTLSKQPVN